MARPQKRQDAELLESITRVFREEGYAAASLSRLAEASGLKRASLYHRFPGGKEAMASEALAAQRAWAEEHILGPLEGPGAPRTRLDRAAGSFRKMYKGGAEACLINLFGTPESLPDSLREGVQSFLSALIGSLSAVLEEAGLPGDQARIRALRGVALIQGAVVVARSFQDQAPFEAVLADWTEALLRGAPERPIPADPSRNVTDIRKRVAAHLSALKADGHDGGGR